MPNVDPWRQYERLAGLLAADLTAGERRLVSIGLLRTEMSNGGFHQYLFNSAGDSAVEAADAAATAGATDLESLVRRAIDRLGGADPTDRAARQDALEHVEPAAFADLDESFLALESTTDLDELMRGFTN